MCTRKVIHNSCANNYAITRSRTRIEQQSRGTFDDILVRSTFKACPVAYQPFNVMPLFPSVPVSRRYFSLSRSQSFQSHTVSESDNQEWNRTICTAWLVYGREALHRQSRGRGVTVL